MMTVKLLTSASNTSHYHFKQEGDYLKYMEKSGFGSEWYGRLSEELGMSGTVSESDFNALLEGQLPNGETMGVIRDNKRLHRPGVDLTFSAPKSVSILWMLGDERLFHAHLRAVKAALTVIESDYANARKTINGDTRIEKTDNLAFALFHHPDSRELEPNLHTHSLTMNMTKRADGQIRALASSMVGRGFSEQMVDYQKTLGLIYRSALAKEVADGCGYDIRINHQLGTFEIADVPQAVIDANSTRTMKINALQREKGYSWSKVASLITRPPKQNVDLDEIRAKTQDKAQEFGFDSRAVIKDSYQRKIEQQHSINTKETTGELLNNALHYACRHLSEREAVFSHQALFEVVALFSMGKASLDEQAIAIDRFIKDEKLIPVNINNNEGIHYTVARSIALERRNILSMQQGQGKVNAFMQTAHASAALKAFNNKAIFPLTEGQYQSALNVLTTQDSISGIQGYSGVGKTTMMKAVKLILEKENVTLVGIAPTAAASRKLEEESGIASMTLTRFIHEGHLRYLSENKDNHTNGKVMLLVDEASMLSTKQQYTLARLRKEMGAHLVLSGDKAQLAAIEAGKPFAQAQGYKMQTGEMKQVVRQAEGSKMYEVTTALIKGQYKEAFSQLDKNMIENNDKSEQINQLCDFYFSLDERERRETLVVTPSNKDRKMLNEDIRARYQQLGKIANKELTVNILVNKGWTHEEKKRACHYKPDDIIRFNRSSKQLEVKRGTYATVIGVDNKNACLTLSYFGKEISWQPHRTFSRTRGGVEVFEKEERKLAKGDSIRWTRNFNTQNRINSETATILSVRRNGKARVRLTDGSTQTLSLYHKDNQHFDHAYAMTVYSAQGQSVDRVIGLLNSYNKSLISQSLFYVLCTRAKKYCHLFVDNKDALLKAIIENSGEKSSSLESLEATVIPVSARPSNTNKNANQLDRKSDGSTYFDIGKLKQSLSAGLEKAAKLLLGEPNHSLSNNTTLRYGNKGSLAVTVKGQKAGSWHNFETGEGGHLLQLWQQEKGNSFIDTCKEVQAFLGGDYTAGTTSPDTKVQQNNNNKDSLRSMGESDKKAILRAQSLWEKGQPLAGTVAEVYLKKHREIDLPKWPKVLRYLPQYYHPSIQKSYPALMVCASRKGDCEAVQVIVLDSKSGDKANVTPQKITQGRLKFGACVEFDLDVKTGSKTTTFIAEGPETALSILMAKPEAKVKATLSKSNFKNIEGKNEQVSVFCLDNDGPKATDKLLASLAASKGYQDGHRWVMPEKLKTDFNDLLKEKGVGAVNYYLDNKTGLVPKKDERVVEKNAVNQQGSILNKQYYQQKFTRLLSDLKASKLIDFSQQDQVSYRNKSFNSKGQSEYKVTEPHIYTELDKDQKEK